MLAELTKQGVLVKVGAGVLMHREHWDRALGVLRDYLGSHPEITLGEFRDLLGTSRKYAVMLLETYDQLKITKKAGGFLFSSRDSCVPHLLCDLQLVVGFQQHHRIFS